MKQREKALSGQGKKYYSRTLLLLSVVLTLVLLTSAVFAESTSIDVIPDETVNGNVELTPGYIGGELDLGGQNISYFNLTAESADYFARIYPAAEGTYSMTVNVPMGEVLEYTVKGTVLMDNYKTRMFFKDRVTSVEAGQTSRVDIIIDPGYISGEIIVNDCNLAKSQVMAYLDNGDAFSRADINLGSENTFRLPVQPNNGIRVYGQTQLTNGQSVALEGRVVDVFPGVDTKVTWELNCGQFLSAIQHDVDYHMQTDYHYTYLYYQGGWSSSRSARHEGSYLFDKIAPGDWRLYTYTYWNNGHNYITKDIRDISAPEGETVYVPIDEYPGFLQGRVTLTGTKTMQDTYYAYIYAYGKNSLYPSYRSQSRSLIDKSDGSFNLALSHGEWALYNTYFLFYNPVQGDDYLYSQLTMYTYMQNAETLLINNDETLTGHDYNYETGSATIKYSRSDGGEFSSPYLYAKSYNRDASGRLESYYNSYANGTFNADKVTFVGFPGTYEVEAWAKVDGSVTTFGKAIVEIVAGVEKVIDIGGPALNVITPEPNSIVEENIVTVSGTATDDMGVAIVTVNGVEAVLVSTDNPDDPNEVSFSVEIELLEGENVVETIATDTSDNQSSDSRNVTYEVPEVTAIAAVIDIKPGSCKNPLNVKSKGVLPVVILGSSSLNVKEIDTASIWLNDVDPLRSSIEDVTGSNCAVEGSDGYLDLTLKFDTQEIVAAIGEVQDGDVVTLYLTGTMLDGTELSGDDIVTVLVKGKKK